MKEAKLWQMVGILSFLGGLVLYGGSIAKFGFKPADVLALVINLSAAFLSMAGAAGVVAGGIMAGLDKGEGSSQGNLWTKIGILGIVVGVILVLFAAIRSGVHVPSVAQIWVGIAGSSALLAGIHSLLAARMVAHIGAPKAQAKAAGAD